MNGGCPGRRVLVVVQRLPIPPRGGADLRSEQVVELLAREAEVGVVALTGDGRARRPPPGVALWREPPAAGGALAADALDWLRVPDGHPSDRWWTPGAAALVDEALAALRPDVVVLEQVLARRALGPARGAGARVVLDAHNVEGDLHRELAHGEGAGRALRRLLAERTAEAEAALVASVDQVWACSERDAALLRAAYPACAAVRVVPNGVAAERYAGPRRPEAHAPLVVLPGSFGYPPNVRAARWLIDGIAPALRRRVPAARVALVGAGPPADLVRAGAETGVEVTGAVDDVVPWLLAASAMAIPLREGGGTRLKALEAFAAGLPVVGTAKALEGLDAQPGRHYLRAETTEELAEALARACTDRELAAALARNGRRLVSARHSREAVGVALAAALDALDGATSAARAG